MAESERTRHARAAFEAGQARLRSALDAVAAEDATQLEASLAASAAAPDPTVLDVLSWEVTDAITKLDELGQDLTWAITADIAAEGVTARRSRPSN